MRGCYWAATCLIEKTLVPDCFQISIGYWRFASRSFVSRATTFVPSCNKHSLVLVSCTTISVYVNLSKNVLYKRAHQRSATSRRGGFTSFAGAKVRFFREPAKHFEVFFKKRCIFAVHTLYIIYARDSKRKKKAVTRTKGDCRLCCRKGIFLLVPSDWGKKEMIFTHS